MADITHPESMEQLIYFTNRTMGEGKAMAWVYKADCPECGKAKMGKPVEKGKVKIRAKEYVCPECGHTEEKVAHEEKLEAQIDYTCPHCKHKGGAIVPFKRKTIAGVKTLRAQCESCNGNIDITKKMAEPKKKKKKAKK